MRTLADKRWEEVCKLVDRLRNGRKPDPPTADLVEKDLKTVTQAKKRMRAIQTTIKFEE